jgi:hypothetical protein
VARQEQHADDGLHGGAAAWGEEHARELQQHGELVREGAVEAEAQREDVRQEALKEARGALDGAHESVEVRVVAKHVLRHGCGGRGGERDAAVQE